MYTKSEIAAFAALLDRARANDVIPEDDVESILPEELATVVIALSIKRENEIIDRYDEEVAKSWRVDPPSVKEYKGKLRAIKSAYKAAPAKLTKLLGRRTILDGLIAKERDLVANGKAAAQQCYASLSPDDRLWTVLGTESGGWPPELGDDPPMKLVLPGEELPTAYALRRVLTDIVETKR